MSLIFKRTGTFCSVVKTLDTNDLAFVSLPDDCPPAPAPFQHRIVSAKQVPMGSYYSIMPDEVLGGCVRWPALGVLNVDEWEIQMTVKGTHTQKERRVHLV